jgi:L-2-hydroxycarboxylate dehydrogenase (NAD+)
VIAQDQQPRRFKAKSLVNFTAQILTAAGLPQSDAETVAHLIIQAEEIGSDSHGIFRLPQYVDDIRSGKIKTDPNIHIKSETNATAVINGDKGFGHLILKTAIDVAIKKAAAEGAAWIGINHGNLAGPGAIWVRDILSNDMIGIFDAVGGNNLVLPRGGSERLLGSNPIAIGVPGLKEPPIVLDTATTVASNGSIHLKAKQGQSMPEGWMVDYEGKPLTDPAKASDGFLPPPWRLQSVWVGDDGWIAGRGPQRCCHGPGCDPETPQHRPIHRRDLYRIVRLR